MTDTLQRDALLRELVYRMEQRANGILFVATGNNQAISMGLTDGRLTYCVGGRAHGQESLLRLTGATVASFSFTEGGTHPFRSMDEIVHEEGMAVLQPLIPQAQPEDPPPPAEAPQREAAELQRMYRGRPVGEPQRRSATPPTPEAAGLKPVRYYRGQPVRG